MRESTLWQRLRKVLPISTHFERIESTLGDGIPDVNMCLKSQEIWLELKVATRPKRATTKIRVDHFSIDQKGWMLKRTQAGGHVFLLLAVEDDAFYLFTAPLAVALVGKYPEKVLREHAINPCFRLENIPKYLFK